MIELDVTGVQYNSGVGANRDRERVGNRVVDGEVLAVERAVSGGVSFDDLDEVRSQAMLAALGGNEGESELRADDRNVRAQAQQER